MFSKRWWKQTAERMAKTAAQTYLALVGVDSGAQAMLTDYTALPWTLIGITVAGATTLSLASSVLFTGVGPDKDSPSAV